MSDDMFTPGPWIAKKGAGWFVSRPNARIALAVGMRPDTSLVTGENDHESESRANANLIASAPDLYEALKSCLNFMENTESELGFNLESADQARAALAKARGES